MFRARIRPPGGLGDPLLSDLEGLAALSAGLLRPSFLLLLRSLPIAAAAATVFTIGRIRVPNFTRRRCGTAGRSFLKLVGLFRIFELEEVGHIKERVALQANVHKCGLHARKNSCDSTVVNGARECVLVFAFVVDFRELIVF
jgi:hypothetical protein